MTIDFTSTFVTGSGVFLPGEPIDNDAIDAFIAPLDARSARIKRRILADNGIKSRHYAIDRDGRTLHSSSAMAAHAARAALLDAGVSLERVSALCTGSSGGDLALPGFANMLQGELGAGPMHTSSHQGVCASGMAALQHAASLLELGDHPHALVVASELPSRMFKRSRYAPRERSTDFDAHFLRWMLSDGAGALLLSRAPRGLSLRLDWLHLRSFSGDHPVCMRIGDGAAHASYLDYPSLAEAEQDGAFLLRQDIRLLPRLFELGIHEYVSLIRRERIDPRAIDHFLCHYSSAKFAPQIEALMRDAGFLIPRERWFSNLERCGNTGSASIFVMLDALRRERTLQPGQRVLCFVPESGRFTVAFAQLTVVEGSEAAIPAPHAAQHGSKLGALLAELAELWQDYQSRLRRTPLLRKIAQGTFTREDYVRWMSRWIPQVRYGSHWMRSAIGNVRAPFEALVPLIEAHAHDEQLDYEILYDDYRRAGGLEQLDALQRNAGGDALNAFMFARAQRSNPVDLLGAIYIIEGTGQRVIPQLLPALRRQLELPKQHFRFLRYHGENDQAHLARWLQAVEIVLAHAPASTIADTARATAELYLLQFQGIEVT
jgi:3-oxoacyl-[acyl-carrier-protein] synthase-3